MSAYDKQIGGNHYQQNFKIQPSKFVIENELLFPEGSAIKYICRHRLKNGLMVTINGKRSVLTINEDTFFKPQQKWKANEWD